MPKQNTRYITKIKERGWFVRLPARVGGEERFFNNVTSMEDAREEAEAWRDSFFQDTPMNQRFIEGAGVYLVQDKFGEFYAAVWQFEKRQIRRLFSTKTYGYLAETVAHIARDIGIRVEQDRLKDHYEV